MGIYTDDPICRLCNEEEETASHIILECPALTNWRHSLLGAENPQEAFPKKNLMKRLLSLIKLHFTSLLQAFDAIGFPSPKNPSLPPLSIQAHPFEKFSTDNSHAAELIPKFFSGHVLVDRKFPSSSTGIIFLSTKTFVTLKKIIGNNSAAREITKSGEPRDGRQTPISPETSRKLSEQLSQEVKKKNKRKKKKLNLRQQEVYCDKDRAAAVNLGSKDIKQDLRMKKKEDRTRYLQIPEEAEPSTFLALGNYEMCRGDLHIAIGFITKALELNPTEKNALVARSKCFILLGQPENALKDAEMALQVDKHFLKGIYQKAEAFYYLGDFEHSLMYYHRGLHIRPDHEGFKLGVHKAQKAIENAIGQPFPESVRSRAASSIKMPERPEATDDTSSEEPTEKMTIVTFLLGGSIHKLSQIR
ncbi:hypothetical protein NQ317_006556 [Molorchus minor]|uniref:Outer dynein arm-docking complex subunit 4 n=1 Tax=Molorchus minor TaxID=1323400 RepID=A0ABQ9K112_9CUCU|nr:hypothetical protein NQ317_006556 [Molorchus minor]